MGVCLRHVETISRDRFFLLISPLFAVKKGDTQKNLPRI